MKRTHLIAAAFFIAGFSACKKQAGTPAAEAPAKAVTQAELTAMANAVPSTGPREGNNYKVFFLVLRQDQRPAAGFPVDIWVKGKSEPATKTTDPSGLVKFETLPFPDAKHPLNAVLHYYKGANDQPREITYPYIDSDAYRLKDVQYIPNMVTPAAETK